MMTDRDGSTLIISVRNLRKHAAYCALYEFEDLIQSFSGAYIHSPHTEHPKNRKIYRGVKMMSSSNALAQSIAQFPTIDALNDEHELILVSVDNPYQLHLLNQIKGWRESSAKKACYLFEVWPHDFDDKLLLREPFSDYDHVFISTGAAGPLIKEKMGVNWSYFPPGVDTDLFSNADPRDDRPIDVAYLGRQRESIHNRLLQARDRSNLFYLYDTTSGLSVEKPAQHRRMYSDILKRSKCTIAFPAKMDHCGSTKSAVEIGMRYFEFAAAGSIILGLTPENEHFDRCLGWEDSVIDIDEDSLPDVLQELLIDEERRVHIARTNQIQSLLRNDWVYRWLDILDTLSLKPSDAVLARKERLQEAARALG